MHLDRGSPTSRAVDGRDLLWLGRIDEQKAPHLAVMAAELLGRRIRVVGPIFDPAYVERHASVFGAEHVEMVGELGGAAKVAALRDAAAVP